MTLSDEELERYARHIVLREVGGSGQAKLKAASVLVIGAGGIGSPALQYLAAAGIGYLAVADNDRVELSNLQRQTLFGTDDVGKDKAATAVEAMERLNPTIRPAGLGVRIDGDNVAEILDLVRPDVIIDGTDNFATRLLVADAALAARVPLVSAAVAEFEGQLGTFRGWESDKPCYRCFVGSAPEREGVSCAEQGVLGALTGLMGSLAALETIRAIAPFGEDSAGKLLLVDALSLRFRSLTLPKDPGCPACGAPQVDSGSNGTIDQPSKA
ncbi:adenylyltransferase/sulfurtransferase [Sphingomonas naasensis]|uniref:Molybdopterin-synthase adenylyltransferase MoeB n=1 Tax=Sphingomonas naasensis TaxID=1344951 RepID=A0A4S1WXT8_9SPHN|nr:molybdopterin-synthase adenylyltransferase MoeB [Sphingomonas naasensis]NIJ19280.1 adenylyltransferase/sulfurtransferase [Sphingomonas naasensis]TGX46456.1 molybdopterin-synthase adenylyltransferase MoeB [Sphingomonas naasensis]